MLLRLPSQAVVWCPTVTVPSRVPLCGHLPRGQRRELLWFIQREAPFVEGRVEVVRCRSAVIVNLSLLAVQEFELTNDLRFHRSSPAGGGTSTRAFPG